MGQFVDLGVSYFDESFTLDPFPYLEELYGRDDVLGFRADEWTSSSASGTCCR